MKFLKQKNISKFSITDQTLFTNQFGRAVMGLSGGLRLPQGTTAQRPIVTNEVRYPGSSTEFADGTIRYNLDTNSLEALIAGEWEIVRAPGANTIKKQTLSPGDGVAAIFGPLAEIPSSPPSGPISFTGEVYDYNIMVFVENVFQISVDNYDVLFNYLGSGDAYLEFTSPVPLGKNVTVYFGFAN
jgi:hypothetical protein